jgi:hypothetical protein
MRNIFTDPGHIQYAKWQQQQFHGRELEETGDLIREQMTAENNSRTEDFAGRTSTAADPCRRVEF